MKFENFVIVSSQITVNSNNYDIQTYIFQSYYLFPLLWRFLLALKAF